MNRLCASFGFLLLAAGGVAAQCGLPAPPPGPAVIAPAYPLYPAAPPRPAAPIPPAVRPQPVDRPSGPAAPAPGSNPGSAPTPGKPAATLDRPTEAGKPKRPSPEDFSTPGNAKEPEARQQPRTEQYLVPLDEGAGKPGPRVRVGFFNHTDRELTLTVNGQEVKIPADQFVSLRLPRTFTWGIVGQPVREAVVPPDADGMEIVFRK